jgi:hypothetical protein
MEKNYDGIDKIDGVSQLSQHFKQAAIEEKAKRIQSIKKKRQTHQEFEEFFAQKLRIWKTLRADMFARSAAASPQLLHASLRQKSAKSK